MTNEAYFELVDLRSAPELDLSGLSAAALEGITEFHRVAEVDGELHMESCADARRTSDVREVPVGNLFSQLPGCCDEDVSEYSASATILAQLLRGVRGAEAVARQHLGWTRDEITHNLHPDLTVLVPQLLELSDRALARYEAWVEGPGEDFLRALSAWTRSPDSARPGRGVQAPSPYRSGRVLVTMKYSGWHKLREEFGDMLGCEVLERWIGRRAAVLDADMTDLLEWLARLGVITFDAVSLEGTSADVAEVAQRLLLDGFASTQDALEAARELV